MFATAIELILKGMSYVLCTDSQKQSQNTSFHCPKGKHSTISTYNDLLLRTQTTAALLRKPVLV